MTKTVDELMTAAINIIRRGSTKTLRMIILVVCWSSHILIIILIMDKTTGKETSG